MLTLTEYEHLWQAHFFGIVPAGVIMPDYCEYLNREHMVEDYLDIFRGINTRASRAIQPCNGWYYTHPFFDEKGKGNIEKPLCIKYILIAEACPAGGANYFYDINEINDQGYLNAAYNATYGCAGPITPWVKLTKPIHKVNSLLDLAKRGVLLLDIFPFAIKYSTAIRHNLNKNGTTAFFWNNPNQGSLKNRVNTFTNLLCNDWDLCMIGPPIISLYVLNNNPLVLMPGGLHSLSFTNKYTCPHKLRSGKSDFKKFAINRANNPDADLITCAFI